ncbi:hypothetical protein JTE90_015536 [Oedothorax gibbosus]|uniref:Protein kinase domain-containing protein n=1 Tax=Oedothorax gibbosus TaxID=931172 RepID=A0AAV6TP24_9ARAC|nr:hypothetical protein JTE90_015536 [Oedothorax gibbosus]
MVGELLIVKIGDYGLADKCTEPITAWFPGTPRFLFAGCQHPCLGIHPPVRHMELRRCAVGNLYVWRQPWQKLQDHEVSPSTEY